MRHSERADAARITYAIALKTMELRILKRVDRTTGLVEIWDGDVLMAEVFAREDGARRLHMSKEGAAWGGHWETLARLAHHVMELLDVADEEMRLTRELSNG